MGVTSVLLICEAVARYRQRGKNLSRNSVKEAIDTLPDGICYFAPSGAVKLCNLQMHRLFRSLAQTDMQTFEELQKALEECDTKSGIIRLSDVRQTYLFPSGKAWRYSQTEITALCGVVYKEVIFSDVTQLYEKNLKLKEQTGQLKKISRDLKVLSDNVSTMTKEKELLTAKTRLHDRMSGGILAMRQILQQEQTTEETVDAVSLFQKAVSAIKNDNEYPLQRGELAEFMSDADTIGVKVELNGELPQQQEVYRVFLIAMRECLTNSVRHANATILAIDIHNDDCSNSIRITNNGKPPESKVTPKGGLLNLYNHITNLGGTMEIQSNPFFELIVTLPKIKEGTE
ncbi:MAG: sensor histidine kinase [Ruminococcus sp.]